MTIQEQINLRSKGKGCHRTYGSGLTNVMFMKPGTCCIEIDKCYRKRYDILCHFSASNILISDCRSRSFNHESKIEAEKAPIQIDKCIDFIEK